MSINILKINKYNHIRYYLIFFFWIWIQCSAGQAKDHDKLSHLEPNNKCTSKTSSTHKYDDDTYELKNTRYILYNVNPGEGFNLRRDIYVRIAPLIKKLNAIDSRHKWILVLPVWGHLPHWKTRKLYSWRTFFQLDKINEYIPAIEFEDFMDEFGLHESIDIVFQLQHFPFNENEEWNDKIEFNARCFDSSEFQWDENLNHFSTFLWNYKVVAKRAECMALRGTASTLLKFLLESNYRFILFTHAEVLLWDDYGDVNWWRARQSLQFAEKLIDAAKLFIQSTMTKFDITLKTNPPNKLPKTRTKISGNSYIGVHLRRRDFIKYKTDKEIPTMKSAAAQVYNVIQMLDIYYIFMATDAFKEEVEEFKSELLKLSSDFNNNDDDSKTPIIIQYTNIDLSEGEIAIIDQILCSWSFYFIGTKDSTFTTRIYEEREILGFESRFTFNTFCPSRLEIDCERPTKWVIKYE